MLSLREAGALASPCRSNLHRSRQAPPRDRSRPDPLGRRTCLSLLLPVLAFCSGTLLDRPAEAQTSQTVQAEWEYVPSGVSAGQSFRLLFVTSTSSTAASSEISTYNSFVQARANTNTHLSGFSAQFRALISTSAVDARTNTATTGTGVPIYWLGGAKAADNYADFYDGSWDSGNAARTEDGGRYTSTDSAFTGSKADGTKDAPYFAGGATVRLGVPNGRTTVIGGGGRGFATVTQRLYALSPVITVLPAKPTGFTAKAGNTQVTLSWANPSDSTITKYQVTYRRKDTPGATTWADITGSSATTTRHTVTGLMNDVAYVFWVRAVSAVGNGMHAGPAEATPVAPPKPSKPTLFQAKARDTQVALSWTDPSDSSITKYQYRQKTGSGAYGSWTDIQSSAPGGSNATSYTVTSLSNGTEYRFRLRAVNAQGNGPESDEAGPVTPKAGGAFPKKPTGFTATQTGNAEVTLKWDNPNDSNIVKYRVYVEKEGGRSVWNDILGSNADTTSHILTGREVPTRWVAPVVLENGASYAFRVKAVYEEQARTSSYGEIPSSDPVRVKLVLLPPTKPDVYEVEGSTGKVSIAWNNLYDPTITKYQVAYRKASETGTNWRDIEGSGADTTYHTVYGLEHGANYRLRIRAVNARGAGPASDEWHATAGTVMAPEAPAPALEWARVNGAEMGLRFDKGLDESSVPSASAFAVSVAGSARSVSSVSVRQDLVTLTLASAVTSGETVTVGYTPPSSGGLRLSGGGAAVAAFSGQSVTNDTPAGQRQAAAPLAPAGLTAAADGRTAVSLSWTAPPSGGGRAEVTGYEVRYGPEGGALGGWTATGSTSTSHSVGGLEAGTSYRFAVRAMSTVGESPASNEATATTEASREPLTASVSQAPAEHDGGEFAVRIEFSEDVETKAKDARFRVQGRVGGEGAAGERAAGPVAGRRPSRTRPRR